MVKAGIFASGKWQWWLPPLVFSLLICFAAYARISALDTVLYLLPGALAVVYTLVFHRAWLIPVTLFTVPFSIFVGTGGGTVISIPSELLIGITVLLYAGRSILRPSLSKAMLSHPLMILLLVELGWMIVSSAFSSLPEIAGKRILVRVCYLFVFVVLMAHWMRKPKRRMLPWILYGAGCVYPVINSFIVHAYYNFSAKSAYWMTKPFFSDHTIYGACLAFIMPGLFILLTDKETFGIRGWKRFLLFLLFLLVFIGEVLSFSRAAWLSLVVMLVLALLIRFRVKLWMLISVLVLIIGIVWVNKDAIINSVSRNEAVSTKGDITQHIQSVTNIQTDASNLERVNRWACAIGMASEKPVFGFGPGSYQFVYGRFQVRAYMTRISTFNGNKGHAHSELFTALSEQGYPGMVIYLVLMFSVIGYGLKVIYSARDQYARKIALAALLSLSTFYVHGFFNAFMDTDKMAALVFVMLAVIISTDLELRRKQKEEKLAAIAAAGTKPSTE